MMEHDGDVRAFVQTSRAWYADTALPDGCVDEVLFGFYAPHGGGTSGEMEMRWVQLRRKVTPMLRVFDDGWHALAQFGDLLARMAEVDGQDITPEQFCAMLTDCGFEDRTPVERR